MNDLALLRGFRAGLPDPSDVQRARARVALLEATQDDAVPASPGPRGERRLSGGRAVSIALAVLAIPATIAVATEGGTNAFEEASRAYQNLKPLPNIEGEGAEVDHFIEGPLPIERVQECRDGTSGMPADSCALAIAVAEGLLPPGEYSDEELERKLGQQP